MSTPIQIHVPAATLGKVLKISNSRIPEFRFEWHPSAKRVYAVRKGVQPEVGELVAFDVETHGAAINAVNTWCRGYLTARAGEPLPYLII